MDLPKFGEDTAQIIARLELECANHYDSRKAVNLEYEEKVRALQDKYQKMLADLEKRNRERLEELARLRDKMKKEEEAKIFERTAQIVKEIVADFAAWSNAHLYQVEDVISIVHAYLNGERGMLNANEMGLGKTFETIVANYIICALFEKEHGRKPNLLWLTKSSILETNSTKNEIARWHPELKIVPISGSIPKQQREFLYQMAVETLHCPVITNYETIRSTDFPKRVAWDIIVMDEVHKLKGGANVNGPTAIWEAVRDISRKAKFMQILSGTPIVNAPEEMWSYLHIFDPVTFNDAKQFRYQFSNLRSVAGELKYVINTEKLLNMALKGRMIRRTAKEVGQELPELTQIDTVLKHNEKQAAAYQQMREQFFVWLDQATVPLTATAIIAQLTRLRQINVWPVFDFNITDAEGNKTVHTLNVPDSSKIDEVMDIIFLAQDQVVIGSNFNTPMKEIKRRATAQGLRCEIISSEFKDKMGTYESDFQQGKIDVLCVNLAMGEGLNLQKNPEMWPGGAAVGITLDRWWNSARNEQFMARIYRQGASLPVFFYHLYVEHSVDYFIKTIIEDKDMQTKMITESKVVRPASEWKKYLGDLI